MDLFYLFTGAVLLCIIGFALWRAKKDPQSGNTSFRR